MQHVYRKNGFDRVKTDVVGDLVRKGSGTDWYRAGAPADIGATYAVIMVSMRMGSVLWANNKISDLQACYVISDGVPDGVLDGYQPYSSVMLLDEAGVICTFTSSSWGGKNALEGLIPQYIMQRQAAFPLVKLGSRARGNQYGTVDPTFTIVGWSPRDKFDAIVGPEPTGPIPLAAPEAMVQPAPRKKVSTADIIDDDIPFSLAAAFLMPLAMLVASHVA